MIADKMLLMVWAARDDSVLFVSLRVDNMGEFIGICLDGELCGAVAV